MAEKIVMVDGKNHIEIPMEENLYILEAKVGPNNWKEIVDIYPDMGIESRYSSEKQALLTKSKLKSSLSTNWKGKYKKHPIRVRKMEFD